MAKKRTDIHRKGAIIPCEYRYVISYTSRGNGPLSPNPDYGKNCVVDGAYQTTGGCWVHGLHHSDECCVSRLEERGVRFASHGHENKCTACGAHFCHGDVWQHEDGEHIFLGHDCAGKYGLMANRTEWQLGLDKAKRNRAVVIKKQEKVEKRAAVITKQGPWLMGLAICAGLHKNDFLSSIVEQVLNGRTLSEKQIAIVWKIAMILASPKEEKKPSEWVGDVGTRIELEAKFIFVAHWDSEWGTQHMYCFEINGGDRLVWKTGNLFEFDKRSLIQMRGTIKTHSEYKGEKQTILTRCKIKQRGA